MVQTPVTLPQGPPMAAEGPAGSGLAGCQQAVAWPWPLWLCAWGFQEARLHPEGAWGEGALSSKLRVGLGQAESSAPANLPQCPEGAVGPPSRPPSRLAESGLCHVQERKASSTAGRSSPRSFVRSRDFPGSVPPPNLLKTRARRLKVATWPVSLFGLARHLLPSHTFAGAAPWATFPPNIPLLPLPFRVFAPRCIFSQTSFLRLILEPHLPLPTAPVLQNCPSATK